MIRITSHDVHPHTVNVTTEEGAPIDGITGLALQITPNALVRAQVTVLVSRIDVRAHPLLDRQTLEQSAAALGLRLVDDHG